MLFTSRILSIVLSGIFTLSAVAEPKPDSAAEQIRKYNESLDKAAKQLPPYHGQGGVGGEGSGGPQTESRRPMASAKPALNFSCKKEILEAKTLPNIVLVSDVSDSPEAEGPLNPSFLNQVLAADIAALYCKENFKSGLPLETKVHIRNANGVAELLSKMSDGKISIEKKKVASGFPLSAMEKMIEDLLKISSDNKPAGFIPGRTGEVPTRDPFEGIGMPDYGGSDGPPYRYNYTKPFEYGEASGELPPDNEKP